MFSLSDLLEETTSEFEACLAKNKTVKAVYKMKSNLEKIAAALQVPIVEWTIIHVCTAWNVIKNEYLSKFTPNGWINKMRHFKQALDMTELKTHRIWMKELNLFINAQLKTQIDQAAAPYKKRSANKPPYAIWKKIIDHGSNINRQMGYEKQLRAAQGVILLIWTLSSGCRMNELLRLRRSDINVSRPKVTFTYN